MSTDLMIGRVANSQHDDSQKNKLYLTQVYRNLDGSIGKLTYEVHMSPEDRMKYAQALQMIRAANPSSRDGSSSSNPEVSINDETGELALDNESPAMNVIKDIIDAHLKKSHSHLKRVEYAPNAERPFNGDPFPSAPTERTRALRNINWDEITAETPNENDKIPNTDRNANFFREVQNQINALQNDIKQLNVDLAAAKKLSDRKAINERIKSCQDQIVELEDVVHRDQFALDFALRFEYAIEDLNNQAAFIDRFTEIVEKEPLHKKGMLDRLKNPIGSIHDAFHPQSNKLTPEEYNYICQIVGLPLSKVCYRIYCKTHAIQPTQESIVKSLKSFLTSDDDTSFIDRFSDANKGILQHALRPSS